MSGSASPPPLRVERLGDGLTALWLDRTERRNALDTALVEALIEVLAVGRHRAIVLGSADPRSFCGGADLKLEDSERAQVSRRLYDLYELMTTLPVPILAVVEGAAVGGGAQLAIAADLRIGGPGALFRFPGPGHGLAVGAWGLPSLVGRGRALDLCLSTRDVGADEALAIGLLDRVEEDPCAAALTLARRIGALDADAVARVKRVVRSTAGTGTALALESAGNASWTGAVPAPGAREPAP